MKRVVGYRTAQWEKARGQTLGARTHLQEAQDERDALVFDDPPDDVVSAGAMRLWSAGQSWKHERAGKLSQRVEELEIEVAECLQEEQARRRELESVQRIEARQERARIRLTNVRQEKVQEELWRQRGR